MPVHFDLMTSAEQSDLFVALTTDELQEVTGVAASDDKQFALLTRYFTDLNGADGVLNCVYTLRTSGKGFELIDVDLVVPNSEAVELNFVEKLADSSDANEYYLAEVAETGVSFELETVNRHLVAEELEGKVCSVHLCAFALSLGVYDSLEMFNRAHGWGQPVKVGEQTFAGISEVFMAPGAVSNLDEEERGEDDYHTILVAEVLKYQTAKIAIGEYELEFGLVLLKSGAGSLPMIVNLDEPVTSKLAPGKIVMASALIKADFADDGNTDVVEQS